MSTGLSETFLAATDVGRTLAQASGLGDVTPGARIVLARDLRRTERDLAILTGSLQPIRRGVLGPTADVPDLPGLATIHLARRRMLAVDSVLRTEAWFSRQSAVLAHDLPLWHPDERTHTIQRTRPPKVTDENVVRHWSADLRDDEVTEVGGLRCTTLGRTTLDCARHLWPDQALVVADAALARGLDPELLALDLAERKGHRGVRKARTILALADGRSQSPGETLCRLAAFEHGLPTPVPQFPIATALGDYFLDLAWEKWRVALEFDGQIKYTGAFGWTEAEARAQERERQQAIEALGWVFVRVIWAELLRRDLIAQRVAQALRASRFR